MSSELQENPVSYIKSEMTFLNGIFLELLSVFKAKLQFGTRKFWCYHEMG